MLFSGASAAVGVAADDQRNKGKYEVLWGFGGRSSRYSTAITYFFREQEAVRNIGRSIDHTPYTLRGR